MKVGGKSFSCQVWLYVVKEFGLVFAVHQTFLLDHQFCMVESKHSTFKAIVFLS